VRADDLDLVDARIWSLGGCAEACQEDKRHKGKVVHVLIVSGDSNDGKLPRAEI
jgi:hypothetical protein